MRSRRAMNREWPDPIASLTRSSSATTSPENLCKTFDTDQCG